MTESEYKTVVKLMIEKLEQCRDEICEKDAEIDRLKETNKTLTLMLDDIQVETIKEFAEKEKQKTLSMVFSPDEVSSCDYVSVIDNVAEETVGEKQ